MEKKKDIEIIMDLIPAYKNAKTATLMFIYHLIIFIFIVFSCWWISKNFWWASLITVFILTCISNIPFIYFFKNYFKIRDKYLKKFKEHPWQHFWYRYSYTSPFGAVALYYPLILKTDYFLPAVISLPSNPLTKTLFPFYIAIPLGIIILIMGILLISPSKDYDTDMGYYLHLMAPDINRIRRDGIYEYMRHPRFLSRFILSIGLGVLANNLLAISVAIIHFIPYSIYMLVLDKELIRIFGEEIRKYEENVPSFIPKIGKWKKFVKLVIKEQKQA